jgi:hypothetical protein
MAGSFAARVARARPCGPRRGFARMKFARSVPSTDQRAARRRAAAAIVSSTLPTAWFGEFQTEAELAVLQTIMEEVLANGHCQMTRLELAERAGVTPHIVQRTVCTAIVGGLMRIAAWSNGGAMDRISKIEIVDPGWLARAKQLRAGAMAGG